MNLRFYKKLRAMTLTEMLVAMAILVIVMAAILPQFRCIQNSWAYKQSSSEVLQNGRVLMDHITANLSQANQITAVTDANVGKGFIEYRDNDGNTLRYDINARGYVEFGQVGSLYELAGPATQLSFICYDVNNLDIPITDPNRIRMVRVGAILSDTDNPGRSKQFTTTAMLRTNALGEGAVGPRSIFDNSIAKDPALCATIDPNHFLCAYEGAGSYGYAAILDTNTTTNSVTVLNSYQFDTSTGKTPALAQIDATHYLCVYEGPNGDGWAVILQLNPSTWAISKGTAFEYDNTEGQTPAVAKIDAAHFICAYTGHAGDGYAIILTANIGAGTITKGNSFRFDNFKGSCPAIAKIDTTHYLCVYAGRNGNGSAIILIPNLSSGDITSASAVDFDSTQCENPALVQIDTTHYLCSYNNRSGKGIAVIFTAVISPASITALSPYQFDMNNCAWPCLTKIDSSRYLCTYETSNTLGQAAVLKINIDSGTIATEFAFKFDKTRCIASALSAVGNLWFLCAYEGAGSKGYAIMINTDLQILP